MHKSGAEYLLNGKQAYQITAETKILSAPSNVILRYSSLTYNSCLFVQYKWYHWIAKRGGGPSKFYEKRSFIDLSRSNEPMCSTGMENRRTAAEIIPKFEI